MLRTLAVTCSCVSCGMYLDVLADMRAHAAGSLIAVDFAGAFFWLSVKECGNDCR